MRKLRTVALTIASLTLLGCETPTAPASQLLSVSSDGSAITLTNSNSWPVFYMMVDPNMLALLDFALCTDPACPQVAAKSIVHVPYGDIIGYHPGQTAVRLMQWRLRRNSSGTYEATDIKGTDATIQP